MNFLLGNLQIKLLAISLAAALWYLVAVSENPIEARTYYLTVEHGPPPSGLVVMGELRAIPVTVVAAADTLRDFDPKSSLKATAPFGNLHRGHNLVPVRVDQLGQSVIIRRVPDTIPLEVDEIGTARREVVIERLRKVQAGYHEVSVSVNPKEVTIQGPQSQLAGIDAVVLVDLEGRQSPFEEPLGVVVRDATKKRLDTLSVTPAEVTVKMTIQADAVAETKTVGFSLTGQPAAGYRVTNATISPVTVSVTGLAATLDSLPQLTAEPVDITNASSDVVRTVSIRIPTGVLEINPKQVTIHVSIAKNPQVSPGPSPTPSPSP